MACRKKWDDEIVQWLAANVPGRTTKQVTELINQQGFDVKYGLVFTEQMIKNAKQRYKIQSGTFCGRMPGLETDLFPKEIHDYIQENYKGTGPKEMAVVLNTKFKTEYTHQQLKTYYNRRHLDSGLDGHFPKGHIPHSKGKKMTPEQYERLKPTMYKKGHIPKNRMKIGECTHTTDGYLIRKISETGIQRERFEFVHRATWEKHNGPIPEGKVVSFLDGNKDNCNIENLVLLDNDENLELNRSRLRFENSELTKVGVTIAKLKVTAGRRKRGQ